jgi:hypothetical protein
VKVRIYFWAIYDNCTSTHFERYEVTEPESLTTGLVAQGVLCIFGRM